MKRNLRKLISAAGLAGIALTAATRTASAVPINGLYVEDARCDTIPTQNLTHELGEGTAFPANESITVQVSHANFTVCVADDLIANDWLVRMTNTSGQAWKNLFFVANAKLFVGNADGTVFDVTQSNLSTDAFKIDGTVTAGANTNLLSESGTVNEIFEPGETWIFNVSNFSDPAGTAPPPRFLSPGQFALSAPYITGNADSASILAQPVPEPATIGAIGLVAAAVMMRRPRRPRSASNA